MELKIDVPSPKDINKQLVDAVAKSTIGKTLTEEVEKQIENMTKGYYNRPVTSAVENQIQKTLAEIVDAEPFKGRLKEMVTGYLTDETVKKILERVFDHFWKA
jgi:hypothetical protein